MNGIEKTSAPTPQNPLLLSASDGSLSRKLKRYLKSCRPPEDADPKREVGRLPNPAGFCIFLGCGIACLEELKAALPSCYDYLRTVFEDELLNANRLPSAGLASVYFKERLGFGETQEKEAAPPLRLLFEHDMEVDGA